MENKIYDTFKEAWEASKKEKGKHRIYMVSDGTRVKGWTFDLINKDKNTSQ